MRLQPGFHDSRHGRHETLQRWRGKARQSGGRAAASLTPTLRDLDLPADAEKREVLLQLRDRYIEAQKLVSSVEPYANLEWILGARRSPTQDPLGLETRTIELIALWLYDLAAEVDRGLPSQSSAKTDDGSPLTGGEARESMARSLRDATERFLTAFRRLS